MFRATPNWTDPKAIHFNSTYIRTMPLDELLPLVEQELKESSLWRETFGNEDRDWFAKTIDADPSRVCSFEGFLDQGPLLFLRWSDFDPDAVKKNLKKAPELARISSRPGAQARSSFRIFQFSY